MKLITRILLSSALTFTVLDPVFAYESVSKSQAQISGAGTHVQSSASKRRSGRDLGAVTKKSDFNAMAYEPAEAPPDFGDKYFRDRGIGSQS